jgi:asparagine synthase (glutamine-hydrolysing)
VIIHLYEEYGDQCARRLRGMFAFALWDDAAQTLFVASREVFSLLTLELWHREFVDV